MKTSQRLGIQTLALASFVSLSGCGGVNSNSALAAMGAGDLLDSIGSQTNNQSMHDAGQKVKLAATITYVVLAIQEADARQKEEARAKASYAQKQAAKSAAKPRYSAVKVAHKPKTEEAKEKGKSSVMIIDNHSGKAVDDKVYILEEQPKSGGEVKFGFLGTQSATVI